MNPTINIHVAIPEKGTNARFKVGYLDVTAIRDNRGEWDLSTVYWLNSDSRGRKLSSDTNLVPLILNLDWCDPLRDYIFAALDNYWNDLEPFQRSQYEKYGDLVETGTEDEELPKDSWMERTAENIEFEMLNPK